MNGENTGQPVFDPNPTRIPTRILTRPEFRLPIPDPNLIRVKRVDPFLTRTRICPTHTRKFGSGSGSGLGRRVGYKLPGLIASDDQGEALERCEGQMRHIQPLLLPQPCQSQAHQDNDRTVSNLVFYHHRRCTFV